MPVFNKINAIPTGGAIGMSFTTVTGTISLSRAVSGSSTFTTLYNGPNTTPTGKNQYWLDYGELAPLNPTTSYVYKVTDTSGNVVSDAIVPSGAVTIDSYNLTDIVIRLMQAGLNNLTTPPGIAKPTVTIAMPMGGFPVLPYVVIFPIMLEQDAQKIGNAVNQTNNYNKWHINELARYNIQVSVLTANPNEMLFFREAVIGIFKTICATVLPDLGQNVSHNYMATATQVVGDFQNKSPGFFEIAVLLEFTGDYSITISTNYGIIEHIDEKLYDYTGDNLLVEIITPPNP